MIQIKNLSKVYGKKIVIQQVSLCFYEGHIYGLVGANGCGKTTLMRCLCGFSQPTTGYVIVDGCLIGGKQTLRRNPELKNSKTLPYHTIADFAPSTGVIIEAPGFLLNESGFKNLLLLAKMTGCADRDAARRVMTMLGLDPDEKKCVGQYSLGMRQRLGFAQAFMENPSVLILDEPFNALDMTAMKEVHVFLQKFKDAGKTIILASHSVGDIEKACDVIYEMKDGKLMLIEMKS